MGSAIRSIRSDTRARLATLRVAAVDRVRERQEGKRSKRELDRIVFLPSVARLGTVVFGTFRGWAVTS
jgi:hypothetical protein